jgi:hypothetical protein
MDPSTTSALQSKAYTVLTTYLITHQDDILSIEILPPALPPPDGICMQDGLDIGIPKKILALAFLEARKRFHANLSDGPSSDVKPPFQPSKNRKEWTNAV